MPKYFSDWGASWTDRHPGWAMKLWTEREVQKLLNKDKLSLCSSYAQQSDMCRYEIMYREGGVYVDTDMECLKNIEALIKGLPFFAVTQKDGILSNALFGSVPSHPVAKKLFHQSRSNFTPNPWNAMGPPFFTPRALAGNVHVFPRKTFIPFTRDEYKAFPRHPMTFDTPPEGAYSINHRSSVWYSDSTKNLLP